MTLRLMGPGFSKHPTNRPGIGITAVGQSDGWHFQAFRTNKYREYLVMSGHLVFLVGPSGAGKDSLTNYARRQLPEELDVRFARRVITRPMAAGAEQHLAVSPFQFELLREEGEFVMHWSAHGEQFGIDREIVDWMDSGATVIVTGSREYLPKALEQFPDMTVVLVTAPEDVRRTRLTGCLRVDAQAIEKRLQRSAGWTAPKAARVVELVNDGELPVAGRQLVELVKAIASAPAKAGSRRRVKAEAAAAAVTPRRKTAVVGVGARR